jgi:hypothetical protein
MKLPQVLIFEHCGDVGKVLKQIAESKGMLVELMNDLSRLEQKSIPDDLRENRYRLAIINYKWVMECKPDILALVKKTETPYALIYTDFSQEVDKSYEALALWSFRLTDGHFGNLGKLALDLKEKFSLPPEGKLKFVVK